MKASSFKQHFSHFLAGSAGQRHFAAHSHHFWPDVTREAQLRAWDDAARLNDGKWEHIFSEVVPRARAHLARLLNLRDPQQIAFAPNTHELLTRVFSALPDRPLRVLTTDGEFYSFARQLRRWEEEGRVQPERVPADGLRDDRAGWLADFRRRVQTAPDVVFVSQVFFNSGLALRDFELRELFHDAPAQTLIVVDSYHAFGAIPTNLAELEGRIFYLGGGYKYAQAGEGVGFLVVPRGDWRPVNTGWYAEFANLSAARPGLVGYSTDAMAFWGATQDPTGWYRFNAVWDLWSREGVDISAIHAHVVGLQQAFLRGLGSDSFPGWTPCFPTTLEGVGHFLTWQAPSEAQATEFRMDLARRGVIIDQRGARLRFGFGLYQDATDVADLTELLREN
jgi:selenocysteine lyase/cysteine desulfurase